MKIIYIIQYKILGIILAISTYLLIKATTKITYHKIDYEIENKAD